MLGDHSRGINITCELFAGTWLRSAAPTELRDQLQGAPGAKWGGKVCTELGGGRQERGCVLLETKGAAVTERRAGLCTVGTLRTRCSGSCATPPQPGVHMGAREASQIPPYLGAIAKKPPQPLPAWHHGAVSGAKGALGRCASSPLLPTGPCPVVLRSLLSPPSPPSLSHLHDVLNDGGPSGELVGLLADPLLPLWLAPAAQGGLGTRMGTP